MEKYIMISNELEELIHTSVLQEGARLKSIRALSQEYKCSKSTVIKALEHLKNKHLLYAVPKSGYYIIKRTFDELPENKGLVDFTNTAPNWRHFPYSDFQHCLNKAIDTYQQDLFQYGTLRGLPSLIDEGKRLLESYQVYCKNEQIVICSGIQQALTILCQIPFPNNKKTVLIEEPGYHLFMQTLKIMNISVSTIKREPDGIDFNKLEEIFRTGDIKFFYLMPRIHNPLGVSYTKAQKSRIVFLANKYDVYLVEDDYIADFETDLKADPLYFYDINQRVIYLKSFSKIMFPGLRVGFAVLPKTICSQFAEYKRLIDIDSSMFSQGALDIYIKSGMFNRHIHQVRKVYDEKAKKLVDSFELHKIGWLLPDTKIKGAKTFLEIPDSISKHLLINSLRRKDVIIEGLEKNYYTNSQTDQRLKLDVANIDIEKIEGAVEIISNEVMRQMK
ncbi:MAG: PLP-dependent aminotransferase family protein [Hungatella sp.]|jgi:DNA-binding transcriptional MocR family regulator|nr:PLP-dependent aminotransferase family protein [Hungatella sp.]